MTLPVSEARAWLTLTLNPRLHPSDLRHLLSAYGLPEEVLAQPTARVAADFGPVVAEALAAPPDPLLIEAAIAWQADPNHHLIPLNHPHYPSALLDLADPPFLLYLRGNPLLLTQPSLAIVGTRRPTPAGRETARTFAASLVEAGVTVVSGLAYGIDGAAHEGALEAFERSPTPALSSIPPASTVAVVATGVDRVYPAAHRPLAQRIALHGAILSEYPLGTPALPHHFPRRNRLIAALSRGTLVVEAALDSGSLITARLAGTLGRDLFAIPGSIHNPLARGCHRLIREGAKLVETIADILDEWAMADAARLPQALPFGRRRSSPLSPPPSSCPSPSPSPSGDGCSNPHLPPASSSTPSHGEKAASTPPLDDPAAARLWPLLGFDPIPFDALVAASGLTPTAVAAFLLTWELAGFVARLPGDRYQRLR
ncbi:MAG: DNA-processing protein DprA [Hydrogenophilus sp.]|nr:DNA-processing protein DprA [Hydrogenophilus sp.]